MAAEGDDELEWLSDYVLAFLKAPTWVSPIAQFVDERCIIFDNEEENKLEYTICHNEFKQLVDDLLAVHLLELSVTHEQFERFCATGLTRNARLHRVLVEQLLSVDDFLTFKAMMVKRNADLFREALDQLHKNGGRALEEPSLAAASSAAFPASLAVPGGCGTEARLAGLTADEVEDMGGPHDEELESDWRLYEEQLFQAIGGHVERDQLEEALKASAAMDQLEAQVRCEEAEIAQAIALSIQAEEERVRSAHFAEAEPALAPLPGLPASQTAGLAAAGLPPLQAAPGAPLRPVIPRVMRTEPINQQPAPLAQSVEAALRPDPAALAASAARMAPTPAAAAAAAVAAAQAAGIGRQQPSQEEMQERAEHLRRQREVLLLKRTQERERQLGEFRIAKQQHTADGTTLGNAGAPAADGQALVAELSGPGGAPPAAPSVEEARANAVQMRQALTVQLRQTLTRSLSGAGSGGAPQEPPQ